MARRKLGREHSTGGAIGVEDANGGRDGGLIVVNLEVDASGIVDAPPAPVHNPVGYDAKLDEGMGTSRRREFHVSVGAPMSWMNYWKSCWSSAREK